MNSTKKTLKALRLTIEDLRQAISKLEDDLTIVTNQRDDALAKIENLMANQLMRYHIL